MYHKEKLRDRVSPISYFNCYIYGLRMYLEKVVYALICNYVIRIHIVYCSESKCTINGHVTDQLTVIKRYIL